MNAARDSLSATETASLLDRLCRDMGFCLAPAQREKLQKNSPSDPVDYTNAVFLAEGLDPSTAERSLYRTVHALIAQKFKQGGIAVDESPPNNRMERAREP